MKLSTLALVTSYGGTGIEMCGAITGSLRWRRIGPGQQAITLWFGAAMVGDVAAFATARLFQNNQPSSRLWFAFSVVFGLAALAAFQPNRARAWALRVTAGVYLVAWGALALFVEPLTALSTYTEPLHALVILAAAVFTLQRRASLGRGDLFSDAGFLVAAGLAGYAVASVLESLVGQLWLTDAPQYIGAYYSVSNVLTALAEVVIIRALFLEPLPTRRNAT